MESRILFLTEITDWREKQINASIFLEIMYFENVRALYFSILWKQNVSVSINDGSGYMHCDGKCLPKFHIFLGTSDS